MPHACLRHALHHDAVNTITSRVNHALFYMCIIWYVHGMLIIHVSAYARLDSMTDDEAAHRRISFIAT